ncbi:hypothetical protein D3C87_46050 [compost metagenome]
MNLKLTNIIAMLLLSCSIATAQESKDSIPPVDFKLGDGLNFNFNEGYYKFKISGFIQGFYGYEKTQGLESENEMNAKRTYLSISGSLANDKISFLLQNDFSRGESLLDAWVAYSPISNLKLSFGQKQTFTNNREMTFYEDKLQFTDRGIFSSAFSNTGREFGLFAESEFAISNVIIRPKIAITSGDGLNSFGSDSRDVDNGGLKYGGRLDILLLGKFKDGNDGYIADLMHEDKLKILAGAAFSYNNGASNEVGEGHGDFLFYNYKNEEQYPDYRKYYADILLKYKGFSLLGEYVDASALALEGSFLNEAATLPLYATQISQYLVLGNGYNIQGGYVTKSGYALDLRYEKLNPEYKENSLSLLSEQEAYTIGLTKYFKGNNLKIQSAFSTLQAATGNTFSAQLLVQVVF